MAAKKKAPKRFHFQFFLGDTSGDGHDVTEDFQASAAKGEAAIKKAWKAAERKMPAWLRPTAFCQEDDMLPEKVAEKLLKMGCPIPNDWKSEPMELIDMAEIVIWFLNQGDPDLDARLVEQKRPTTIHLPSNIGYGLVQF